MTMFLFGCAAGIAVSVIAFRWAFRPYRDALDRERRR